VDGARLEVKQSALKQSWLQSDSLLSKAKGSFSIREAKGHYEDNIWKPTSGRLADIYVFAWHGEAGADSDHRNISQWHFFVAPSSDLPAGQKSIGLSNLMRLCSSVPYSELRRKTMETMENLPLRSSAV
jgi:hypothetical protein